MQPTRRIRIDSYVDDKIFAEIMSRLTPILKRYIETKANKPFELKTMTQYDLRIDDKNVATFTIRHTTKSIIIQMFPL